MSRIMRFLVAIFVLAAFAFTAQAVEISVPASTQAQEGATVQIPVYIDVPTDVVAFEFTLSWDVINVLEVLSVGEGSLTSGWTISWNVDTAGAVHIGGFNLAPISGTTQGSLCVINFKVTGTAGQQDIFQFGDGGDPGHFLIVYVNNDEGVVPDASGGTFTVQLLDACTVSGTISYEGEETGTAYVALYTSPDFSGEPSYGPQIVDIGTYTINNVAAGTYYACSYLRIGGDGSFNPVEDPSGQYGGETATSFTLTAGQTKDDVDITLTDPVIPDPYPVTIQDSSGVRGAVVNVPVHVDQDAGLHSFKFVIEYDETVITDTVTAVRGALLPASWALTTVRRAPNTVVISGLDSQLDGELRGGGGTLVTVSFQIKGDADEGIYPLSFVDTAEPDTTYLKRASGDTVNGAYVDGQITVRTWIYGDVSGNGTISAYDAALVVQEVVGFITEFPGFPGIPITPGSDPFRCADVSGNGSISSYDAALIVQKAVGIIDKFPVEE